jgi:hypothetical protein
MMKMLLVTNSIQFIQQIPFKASSLRVWRLQNMRTYTGGHSYLLAKKETVLQGMIDKSN